MQYLHLSLLLLLQLDSNKYKKCNGGKQGGRESGKEGEKMRRRGRGREREERIEMNETLFNCQIAEVTI